MKGPLWKFTPVLKGEDMFIAIVNAKRTYHTQLWMFQQVLTHLDNHDRYEQVLQGFLGLVHLKALQIAELQQFQDAAHHALPEDLK